MLRKLSAASNMDSKCTGKRRGGGEFIKGKLRSLYRASSNKVKPSRSRSQSLPATDHGGYMTMSNQQKSNMNMIAATQYYNYNNKVPTTSTSTASLSNGALIVTHLPKNITTTTTAGGFDSYNAAVYGGLQVDESIDLKAANYISSVLERFNLDLNI